LGGIDCLDHQLVYQLALLRNKVLYVTVSE
jgi:hypothetical protein